MAAAAFVIGGFLGLISGVGAGLFFGYGFLACFLIYLGVATLLPLALIIVSLGGTASPDARQVRAQPRAA